MSDAQYIKQLEARIERLEDTLDVLRGGTFYVVAGGHKDGAYLRAVANCVICRYFNSQEAAAQELKLAPDAVSKAVKKMRAWYNAEFRQPPAS